MRSDQNIEHAKQWLKAPLSNLFQTSFLLGKIARKRGFADEGKMRRFLCTLMALSCVLPMARAEEFPPVYVDAEVISDEAAGCGYSHDPIVAAVKSELRHNRIEIASRDDFSESAIVGFIKTVADFRGNIGLCTVRYDFSFWTIEAVAISVTEELRYAQVVFCDKGGILSGPVVDIQSRLNNKFRDYVSQRITEYLKNECRNREGVPLDLSMVSYALETKGDRTGSLPDWEASRESYRNALDLARRHCLLGNLHGPPPRSHSV